MHTGKMNVKRRRAAMAAVFTCLLLITIPLQYLVRREVVVGLPPGDPHAHHHCDHEHDHAHDHTCGVCHPDADLPLGVNLIPNFGFEVGTRERVWGWLRIANDQGAVSYRDERASRRGLASIAVYAGLQWADGAGWITRLDELPLDHDVVLEGYVKTELVQGEAYLAVMYEFEEAGSRRETAVAYTPGVGGESEWEKVNVRCYIPPEAVGVYVLAQVFGQGRAWFDDLSLVVEEKEALSDKG